LLLVWVLMLVAENLSDFGFILSWTNIAIGAIISISLGVVAGIVPAITASRMNPVEAIRSR